MASNHRIISSASLHLLLLILFTKTHLSISIRFNPVDSIADAHDLLPKYGLPKGIIPNNIKSYTLTDDGVFVIQLDRPCYVHFDQLVYYDTKIKGKLSYGSVSDVSGIQAKKLFVWLPVTGMRADAETNTVEFFVGALSQKLPAAQFEVIPECMSKACHDTILEIESQ